MMEISVYDEIYTRLYNIKSIYDNPEWYAIISVCQSFTEIPESLGTDHASIHLDIRGLFFKYLDQLREIVYNDETNDHAQKWCKDNLEELSDLLIKLIG